MSGTVRGNGSSWVWLVVVGLIGVVAVVQLLRGGGVAATPAGFAEGEAAASLLGASEGGGVVMAVVTADWCGPCQSYKRGALSDAEVSARLEGAVERVMVDADAQRELAMRLSPTGAIPTTALVRDGEVVASVTGDVGSDRLLEWLETNGVELAEPVGSGG